MGRGRYVSAAPGRRRARGAAVLAPLLLLAACTGTGGPPPAGSAPALPPTTSVPPPIDAEGRTSPSVVWSAGPALADLRPGYASIKHVRLLDDGGGRVRFGIGLDAVAGYKVSELPPDRMYIDVAA
jgi:hypothetical protein